jgi:putative ABC transport system permease protein
MLKNYLITALRNIRRQKGYSFLNITGLAIGITCFILISLYVQNELSYDKYHKDSDKIYRVCSEHPFVYHGKNQSAITPAPLAPALVGDLPEVVSSVRFTDDSNVLLSADDNKFLEESVYFASPGIFNVFSFHLLKGDPQNVLTDPYSLVLSERMAEKYFGDEDPVGKILKFEDRHDFKVTGVVKDMPKNSHFIADFIAPFKTYGSIYNQDFSSWMQSGYYTYIKLRENTDSKELEGKLQGYMEKAFRDGQDREGFRYFLQPLTKIHLHSDLIGEISVNNDIKSIYIFSFIAFLILIIACINYMNLITARSSKRGKEVGIRKVVGARRSQVIKQFFGESIILASLALLFSLFLVRLILPVFNTFVERNLRLNLIKDPQFSLWLVGILVFTGILAGCYPALVLSSFKPVSILRGWVKKRPQGISLRNILVVVQFSISITLVICTLVIRNQLHYIKNRDVGYRKDQIITMRVRNPQIGRNLPLIKNELREHSSVVSVCSSSNLPHRITDLTPARTPQAAKNESFAMYQSTVDYDFVDLFEIDIVKGRNFSRDFPSDSEGAFLVNETAVKALGYSQPLGKEIVTPVHGGGERRGRIIGVMKDFNMLSLHQNIEPLGLTLDAEGRQRYLSIKIRGTDIPEIIKFIREKMEVVSSIYPFEYQFFDDVFARVYHNEQKAGKMFNTFTLLALVIACLGLLGLTSFATEQRTKEIGIRKVLGSSISGIIVLLSKEFTKWVLLANIFAWPVAYFVMNRWLQNFAFRVRIDPGTFVISGFLTLMMALLTVSFQSTKAAHANPVDSLRYE